MSSPIDPYKLAGAKPKGKRPQFLDNSDTEKLLNVTMALVQELSVMRERLDTVERLLETKGITQQDIESFTPTKAQAEERGAWTQEYLARILRVYQQEIEGLSNTDEPSSEDVGNALAKDT